jgi:hypothetical protein
MAAAHSWSWKPWGRSVWTVSTELGKAIVRIKYKPKRADGLVPFSHAKARSRAVETFLPGRRFWTRLPSQRASGRHLLEYEVAILAYKRGEPIQDIMWRMRLVSQSTLESYLQELAAESLLAKLPEHCRVKIRSAASFYPFCLQSPG